MGLISLLAHNPAAFILLTVPLLYSVIAHELAHGVVAGWFGDTTAKDAGRISLNPLKHLDPMGTLMLFVAGFGWARPVPVNYGVLKRSRLGLIAVSLAGCLTNILLATAALFFLQFQAVAANHTISMILSVMVRINIILGSFNLIPIPPLDGSKVLMSFLPEDAQRSFQGFESYGFFVIIILLFTGVLYPVIDSIQRIIYGAISLLFGAFSFIF